MNILVSEQKKIPFHSIRYRFSVYQYFTCLPLGRRIQRFRGESYENSGIIDPALLPGVIFRYMAKHCAPYRYLQYNVCYIRMRNYRLLFYISLEAEGVFEN